MEKERIRSIFEEVKGFLSNNSYAPLDCYTQLIADNIERIIYKKER